MTILAVDTASARNEIALGRDRDDVAIAELGQGGAASRRLLPCLLEFLARHGLGLADVDAFVVACGPGSFTGLRIGIASLNGLGFALGRPVIGVSTLEALARAAGQHEGGVITVVEAGRGQVFAARFAAGPGEVRRTHADLALRPEQVVDRLFQPGDRLLGNGADRVGLLLPERERRVGEPASIAAGAVLLARAELASPMPPSRFARAVYVRRPGVESPCPS